MMTKAEFKSNIFVFVEKPFSRNETFFAWSLYVLFGMGLREKPFFAKPLIGFCIPSGSKSFSEEGMRKEGLRVFLMPIPEIYLT